jgi:hypothetical protein
MLNRNILVAVFILSISLIAAGAPASGSFILVSDLDDTVKVTHVCSRDNMTFNAVASKLEFSGMPVLYRFLIGENPRAGRLMFLSGSPYFLDDKVNDFLKRARFPQYSLTLRGLKEFIKAPVSDFKKKKMNELYGGSRGKTFILIGDDTERDPEVYADFSATIKKHSKVLAIYIRRITGRELPKGSIGFVTAYDIALHEFKAGRLNEKQAVEVGDTVLNEKRNEAFLPDFQQCPKNYEPVPRLPEKLAQLKKQIEDRMTAHCSNRTPGNTCQSQPAP